MIYEREFYAVQRQARSVYAKAIRAGTLVRPETCVSCGGIGNIEGHHFDYRRPLEVRWLCGPCHGDAHRTIRSRLGHMRYLRWREAWEQGCRDFSHWDYSIGTPEFVEAAA